MKEKFFVISLVIFTLLSISYFFSSYNDISSSLHGELESVIPGPIVSVLLTPFVIFFVLVSMVPAVFVIIFHSIFCTTEMVGDLMTTSCFFDVRGHSVLTNIVPYFLFNILFSLLIYFILSKKTTPKV